MKEKEKKIIEAGISLFAKKGYSSTSIQEIVDSCEMSKGAFYLYFKSKESLLLATFKYQFQSIQFTLDSLLTKDLTPREMFIAQLEMQFNQIHKNKDFLIMLTREQTIPLNPEIEEFIRKINHEMGSSYQTSLLNMYGDKKIDHYFYDLNMILQGIVQAYIKLVIFDKVNIDFHKLSVFILKRIDDLVTGFTQSTEEPILTNDFVNKMSELYPEPTKEDIIRQIKIAKNKVDREDIIVTLDVLIEEIEMDAPRIPVIQGMLGNLKDESTLQDLKTMIETFFKCVTDSH